jgi:hypothetical protein
MELIIDLMWSDPEDIDNWAVSPRGAGWLFGKKVTLEVIYYVNYLIVLSNQQINADSSSASTRSGRVQIHVSRRQFGDCLVSA